MLEPKKPGEVDPNDPGAQSGTTPMKDQKPGFGERGTDESGLPPKDMPAKE